MLIMMLSWNLIVSQRVMYMIDVELIDKCLRNMKRGKASGPDGLCCESLLYAHPKLISLLCSLFRSMSLHHYVPTNFGKGIIVPLVKDKQATSVLLTITVPLHSCL